jgi:hypothetical protein
MSYISSYPAAGTLFKVRSDQGSPHLSPSEDDKSFYCITLFRTPFLKKKNDDDNSVVTTNKAPSLVGPATMMGMYNNRAFITIFSSDYIKKNPNILISNRGAVFYNSVLLYMGERSLIAPEKKEIRYEFEFYIPMLGRSYFTYVHTKEDVFAEVFNRLEEIK